MIEAGAGSASPTRRLLAIAPGARARLVAAIGFGFLAAAIVIGQAYLTSVVVASVFLEGGTLSSTAPVLASIAVLALIRALFILISERSAQDAARRVKGRLRTDLITRISRLGPIWMSREQTGDLAGLFGDGMAAIDAYLVSFQPARWLAVLVPGLVMVVVLVVDPPTTLVLIFTGPILVLLLAFIGGRTRAITARRFAEVRWLSAFFLDMLQGMATLKMFGRSEEQVDNIRTISRRYGDTTMDVLRTAFQTSLVLEWGGAIAVALVAVEISLRLMAGQIEFDRALAVLIIVPEFFLPLRQLATRYHSGAAVQPVAERAFAILDTPVEEPPFDPDGQVRVHDPTITRDAEIRFVDVGYTYPGRREPALQRVDLVLRPGALVAVVGATGAGKTTLTSLLLRFIRPDQGSIRVDDRSLADIDRSLWLARLAWVPQRPHLFHGTVADNIRLARPDADEAAVREAAQAAGADRFISRLPAGYQTQVGERGLRLSGGQRQRLAIARAFLADARVVILDEATSHLDRESETVIRDATVRLAADRIVLVVAHRLRLASVADRVVVLDAGRIVESGAPAELMARDDGAFTRLVERAAVDAGPWE